MRLQTDRQTDGQTELRQKYSALHYITFVTRNAVSKPTACKIVLRHSVTWHTTRIRMASGRFQSPDGIWTAPYSFRWLLVGPPIQGTEPRWPKKENMVRSSYSQIKLPDLFDEASPDWITKKDLPLEFIGWCPYMHKLILV